MDNKQMNSEITVRETEKSSEGLIYKYKLLMHLGKSVASFSLPLYSVSVDLFKESGEHINGAEINDVFSSMEKANAFFDRIVNNLVTPIDLKFVFEDMITI